MSSLCVATSLIELVAWVGDGVAQGWAADQCHDRTKLQSARSFAFAGAFAGRTAKRRQEAARKLNARVRQGGRPRPGAMPGNFDIEPVTR